MRYLPAIVIMIVIGSVAVGFFIVGLPQEERARRFDDRRVNDLQILQSEILNYWRLKNILPRNLDALKDDMRGFRPPQDPETGAAYEYTATNGLSFKLCATFNRATSESKVNVLKPISREPYGQNWEHTAGRICFTRAIDKDLYPPEKTKF